MVPAYPINQSEAHGEKIHDLETSIASHEAQLEAGREMFFSIQGSIKSLSDDMKDAIKSLSDDLRGCSSQLADLRVGQATHSVQLADLVKIHEKEEQVSGERKKAFFDVAVKVGVAVTALTAASIAGANGKQWLVELFKVIAGG